MGPDPRTTPGAGSRRAAVEALLAAGQPSGFSKALQSAIAGLKAEDAALAREIAEGVLRQRTLLDRELAGISSQPIERLEPEVLAALRVGLYQIRFLDRVPHHAAVSATVAALRRKGQRGFVNAVLRKAAGSAPPVREDGAGSAPPWLHARWSGRWSGPALDDTLQWLGARPAITVRSVRTGEAPEPQHLLRAHPVQKGSWIVQPSFLRTARFDAEGWYVQDAASTLACELAATAHPRTILDLCAAPGGKCLTLLALERDAQAVAVDADPRRMQVLAMNRSRTSLPSRLSLLCADVRALPVRGAGFDLVILDAPCTGWGTLRKNPDGLHRAHPHMPLERAILQRTLLDAAACAVAPGGRLLYNVCSAEPEEGQDVAQAFSADHQGGFAVLQVAPPPAWKESAQPCGPGWLLRPSLEAEHDGGFFALWQRAPRTSG